MVKVSSQVHPFITIIYLHASFALQSALVWYQLSTGGTKSCRLMAVSPGNRIRCGREFVNVWVCVISLSSR